MLAVGVVKLVGAAQNAREPPTSVSAGKNSQRILSGGEALLRPVSGQRSGGGEVQRVRQGLRGGRHSGQRGVQVARIRRGGHYGVQIPWAKQHIATGLEGKTRGASLVKGLHPALDKLSLQAMKRFKWFPAEVNGEKVDTTITYRMTWTLFD